MLHYISFLTSLDIDISGKLIYPFIFLIVKINNLSSNERFLQRIFIINYLCILQIYNSSGSFNALI